MDPAALPCRPASPGDCIPGQGSACQEEGRCHWLCSQAQLGGAHGCCQAGQTERRPEACAGVQHCCALLLQLPLDIHSSGRNCMNGHCPRWPELAMPYRISLQDSKPVPAASRKRIRGEERPGWQQRSSSSNCCSRGSSSCGRWRLARQRGSRPQPLQLLRPVAL